VNDAQRSPVRGRTRWRAFSIVLGAGLALSVAMIFGVANGAIAASVAVSGSTFKISATELDGQGFVQYGGVVQKADGSSVPVAISGIKAVTKLDGLCQSVVVPNTNISLVIKAGNGSTASDMVIDMSQLSGDATFGNIAIGQDASTLDKGPSGAVGAAGGFGQQADTVKITNLRQVAWKTTAGTFTINGLDLHVSLSGEQCFQ